MFRSISSFNIKHFFVSFRYSSNTPRWDIYSSVLLERLPFVARPLNVIEKAVQNAFMQLEITKSLLSDHEIRKMDDVNRQARIKSGEADTKDIDLLSLQSAQEFEDSQIKIREAFKTAPIYSDSETENRKNVLRMKDRRLTLLCNYKLPDRQTWLFPQAQNMPGETLRQTAERAISDVIDEKKIKLKIIGNSPVAVYSYKNSIKVSKILGSIGGKIFFFKALFDNQLASDAIKLNEKVKDYQWITAEEAYTLLRRDYWKTWQSCCFIEYLKDSYIEKILRNIIYKKSNFEEFQKNKAL